MSDIHYVTDQLISEIGRENLKNAAMTEFRLMEEIDAILNAALKGASDTNPDALLICGDLVSNGELLGAKALAAKLGLSSRTIERALQNLQKANVIQRVGSRKDGSWLVVKGE